MSRISHASHCKPYRLTRDSSVIALAAFFLGPYPFILLGDALSWPAGVQGAIGLLGITTLTGVKLAMVRIERRRAREGGPGADSPILDGADGRLQRTRLGRPRARRARG